MNRLEPLAKEKAVPQQDLDNALVAQEVATSNVAASQANYENVVLNQKVSVDQATAAVSAGEASVNNAELNLSYCTVTAPLDGLIGQRLVSIGNLVGRGEPTYGHDFGPGSSPSVFRCERSRVSEDGQTDGQGGQESASHRISSGGWDGPSS